jgi:hypothetical protein
MLAIIILNIKNTNNKNNNISSSSNNNISHIKIARRPLIFNQAEEELRIEIEKRLIYYLHGIYLQYLYDGFSTSGKELYDCAIESLHSVCICLSYKFWIKTVPCILSCFDFSTSVLFIKGRFEDLCGH